MSFFAPAVGLMNRLTYPRKFLLISVLFALPLTLVILPTVKRHADVLHLELERLGAVIVTLKGFHRPMPAVDVLRLKDSGS
jgi:hypothetical protein